MAFTITNGALVIGEEIERSAWQSEIEAYLNSDFVIIDKDGTFIRRITACHQHRVICPDCAFQLCNCRKIYRVTHFSKETFSPASSGTLFRVKAA